jgi:hypothetical protein
LWPIIDVEENNNEMASRQEIIDGTTAFAETVRAKTGRDVVLYGGYYLAKKQICDRMGCSYLWYPSYTKDLSPATLERIGWTADKLFAWQYVGDGKGLLAGYPTTSPVGAIDISVITIADSGEQALAWVREKLSSPAKPEPRLLYETNPMMVGPDVLEVQEQLRALGYASGNLDSKYGPLTARAVRDFQRDHRLSIDGIVGPLTREALSIATARLASRSRDGGQAVTMHGG